MGENPLVSIIVLNWNGIHFIERCLGSLMTQTYSPLEIIVVDNASTDGSREFVEKKFPGAAMLTRIAGGVPCAKTCDEIVKGNVMIVGDAAHQVNPTSGGGIISGMIGGMIAGQVAAEALKEHDQRHLQEYQRRWHNRLGGRHEVFYRIKEAISRLSDEKLNNLCNKAAQLPEEKRTVGGIFRTALWNQPSILIDVAKVFFS